MTTSIHSSHSSVLTRSSSMSDFGCSSETHKIMSLRCMSSFTSHKAPTKVILFPVCLRMWSHGHTHRHTHKPTHTHTHTHNTHAHTRKLTLKQTHTHTIVRYPRGIKVPYTLCTSITPTLGTHLFWSKALLSNWREAFQWSTYVNAMLHSGHNYIQQRYGMCVTRLASSALSLRNIFPGGNLSGWVLYEDRR